VAAEVNKWIVEARQGNREALGRLLNNFRYYLLLMANRKLDPTLWAKVAPSDIVQESLMEAGRNFPRFHGSSEEELLAWLRGILRHIVMDAHRHYTTEKRQVANELPLAELPQLEIPLATTNSPSESAQAREQDEQLNEAVQQLPEHYRQVLRMYTWDKLTFVQIAEKLGTTADAVRKMFRRAIEELTKLVDTPNESV
jgi:RNA polymerase sigma-70 factor (ECF subfamily)